jgi:aminoglycoside phosphotransferase
VSPIEIRPFRRGDRDQLTDLVNAHVEAVLPGVTVPPNAVLGQLEREPGEYGVCDRWPHLAAALHRAGFVPGDRVEAVLAAAADPPDGTLAFLHAVGFRELTRTTRGWTLQ